jgi:hypothetical protein
MSNSKATTRIDDRLLARARALAAAYSIAVEQFERGVHPEEIAIGFGEAVATEEELAFTLVSPAASKPGSNSHSNGRDV